MGEVHGHAQVAARSRPALNPGADVKRPISVCLACGSSRLETFYNVVNVPVRRRFVFDERGEAMDDARGAIELAFCRHCGFIENVRCRRQLAHWEEAFEHSRPASPRFTRQLNTLCDEQIARHGLQNGMTALEIGCGDGEFLNMLCERSGCAGVGIDPLCEPSCPESADANRFIFISDLFGPRYLEIRADYVCCRHTLQHIGPVQEFLRFVRRLIGRRTGVPVYFEVPDMERVLTEGAFWDIYHEHCSYFTAGSLARLFEATGFQVVRLQKVFDEQYLAIEAVPTFRPPVPYCAPEPDIARTAAQVTSFRAQVETQLQQFAGDIRGWKDAGKRVVLWGAGGKAAAFVNALGLREEIHSVVDLNTIHHGKFLPGSGHQIVGPDHLQLIRPDIVLVMNPAYALEARQQLAKRGLHPQLASLGVEEPNPPMHRVAVNG